MADFPVKNPEELGFDPLYLERAFQLIEAFIMRGEIPGATVCVGSSQGMVPVRAFGYRSIEPEQTPALVDTIYDCASLTKVVVTTTLALLLIESGRMRLDDPVVLFIDEFAKDGSFLVSDTERRRSVTIGHLLTHTSGLPAWAPLFHGEQGWGAAIRKVCSTPLAYEPGTKVLYSCLGFILLGEIIRRLTQAPLDILAAEYVFRPLGMADSLYTPPAHLLHRVAPTEREHGVILHGVVHDENARSMGGVAGNAGLFSTAEDLARFAIMILRGGRAGQHQVLSRASIATATRDHTPRLNESRGLGWQIKGERAFSSAGDLFSPKSFGHTGFTGTSLWIDPVQDLFAVLLTNRVHPSRDNRSHIRLRPLFHNAVAAAKRG